MIIEILIEDSSKRVFMERDHMVEALASNGADHSLYIGTLARRARCRQNFYAQVSHLFAEVIAENSIAVAQQVAR
jgi:hypothetical protein